MVLEPSGPGPRVRTPPDESVFLLFHDPKCNNQSFVWEQAIEHTPSVTRPLRVVRRTIADKPWPFPNELRPT